jgi:hypothetical protein
MTKIEVIEAINQASKAWEDVYYLVVCRYMTNRKYGGLVRTYSYFYEGPSLERAFVNAQDAFKERDAKVTLVTLSHANSFLGVETELSKEAVV